jgi:hypothetical protein
MLTLKDWMELVDYRITEGSDYGWQCFGHSVHTLTSWNGDQDGYSLNIVFDTKDQTVYQVEVHDFANDRAYRLTNAEYLDEYKAEAEERGVEANQAWDDVDYIDLETDEDFVEKAEAIIASEEYDTRVQIPVDFSDEELLQYMKLAHTLDITFNQFVEQALTEAIKKHKLNNIDDDSWDDDDHDDYSEL